MPENAADVVVVGAGAAGLMAARELSRAGKRVIVLEARERIGGRILPLSESDFGYEAMAGAEFLHGEAPVTTALVREAGLTLTQGTEWWNVFDGEPSLRDVWAAMPELKKVLLALDSDMTVAELLDSHFRDNEHVREFATRWIEAYDAGEISRASAFGMRDGILHDEGNMQHCLKEGYGALMRFLAADLPHSIRLNECVKRIDFSGETVRVFTARGEYVAAHVIVTVPLPLIKDIEYVPAISRKLEAAAQIGYGSVIKILLRFDHKWWGSIREMMFERLFFMFSNEIVPTWWTQYPEPHPVLTGWIAGPRAHAFRDKTEEELVALALESLANIFTVDLARLRSMLVKSHAAVWDADPFARGGYSYRTPGADAACDLLREPEDGKLYFAGEALGHDTTATVEGALESGRDTVDMIMKIGR